MQNILRVDITTNKVSEALSRVAGQSGWILTVLCMNGMHHNEVIFKGRTVSAHGVEHD